MTELFATEKVERTNKRFCRKQNPESIVTLSRIITRHNLRDSRNLGLDVTMEFVEASGKIRYEDQEYFEDVFMPYQTYLENELKKLKEQRREVEDELAMLAVEIRDVEIKLEQVIKTEGNL